MKHVSRRDFLKGLAASAGLFAAGRNVAWGRSPQASALRLLVVGDSLIWGQGLREEDKFYTLFADWLRKDAFGGPRSVDLKVRAHSGANLKVRPETAERFKAAGLEDNYSFHPEVNVGFPSIWTQIEVAAAEYKKERARGGADLIMLAGGITDVSVNRILDPFSDEDELPPLIKQYCRDDMLDVLRHAGHLHPGAVIVVIGYYPMLSPRTSGSRLMDAWLATHRVPDAVKRIVNNPLTRRLLFNRIRRRVLRKSRIWTEGSNENLQLAVDTFNDGLAQERAVFVRSPITENTAYAMPESLVFRMGRRSRSEDPLAKQRSAECKESFSELKAKTGIENSVRRCELAGLGHPNPAGARAYFDEISSVIDRESWIARHLASTR